MTSKHQRRDGAVGLDAVVPARERGEPPPLPVSAWSNVVPFVRPRFETPPADSAPAILIGAAARAGAPRASPVFREPVKPEPVKDPPKVEPKPVPEPPPPKPAARHEAKVKPKPAPKHEAAREAPRGKTAKRADTPGPRANAANGVGAGRSQNNAEYRGLVSAHLARYKRFPPEAQSSVPQ